MNIFFLTFAIFVLAFAGLALGVLFGRGPLRGSCGGDATIQMCPVCKEEDQP